MEGWKRKLECVIKKWDKGPPSHLLEERPAKTDDNTQQKVPNNVLTVRPKRRTQKSFRKARNERAKEREVYKHVLQFLLACVWVVRHIQCGIHVAYAGDIRRRLTIYHCLSIVYWRHMQCNI